MPYNTLGKLYLFLVPICLLIGREGLAQGNAVFRCTDEAGAVIFSDRACAGNASRVPVGSPSDEQMALQKAEHDKLVLQEKALAEQIQSKRLAEEKAGRAAQDQQMQINNAANDRLEQERIQKNNAVVSSPAVTQSTPVFTVP